MELSAIDISMIWMFLLIGMFAIALIITPLARKAGLLLGIMDKPNARKIHVSPTPRTGGITIYFVISVAIVLAMLNLNISKEFLNWSIILIGIFVLGLLDDVLNLNAKLKFLLQIVLAVIFITTVSVPKQITLPFLGSTEGMQYIIVAFYLIWIVGITNAVNLIDGLDGLASVVSVFPATAMLIMAYHIGDIESMILLTGLIAGLLGFLFFNLKPANIFLGDGGSLLIGFLLATISVRLMTFDENISIVSFIFLMFIPIFDTVWSILRRKLNGKKIFEADKGHLHHKLIEKFGYWNAIIYVYTVTIGLSLAVIGLYLKELPSASLILGIIAMLLFVIASLKAGYFKVVLGAKTDE